jgi:cellulose synthase/poly-beta-1,6-N-acetylglucosamine synthase-like glycosyltransferase
MFLAFLYWLFTAPALLLALLSLRGERARARYVARRLAERPAKLPPATVVVPIKGPEEGLADNLAALAALDYPDFELIVVAHSASDIAAGVLPSRARIVLAHGTDPATSEKIQNLAAAVRVARRHSAILVFADSDGLVPRKWLRALATPLAEPGVGAVTGYRWFLPTPPDFCSALRAVWDAVACGSLGPGDSPFLWGGATAIRKDLFFELRIPELWKGELSDDYVVYEAVRAAGLSIAYAPGAMTPCLQHTTARNLLTWTRRQMAITRVYAPRLWRPVLVAHVLYCAGMAASVVAILFGHRLAAWALIAQLTPGMLKAVHRATLAQRSLPDHETWFRRYTWVHPILVPLATWLWLFALATSAFATEINWRGYRIPLKRPVR